MDLIIEEQGRSARRESLRKLVTIVGLGDDCDISLGPTAKPMRVGIFIRNGAGYQFRPLTGDGSITKNGRALEGLESLKDGEIIKFGPFALRLGDDKPLANAAVALAMPPAQPRVASEPRSGAISHAQALKAYRSSSPEIAPPRPVISGANSPEVLPSPALPGTLLNRLHAALTAEIDKRAATGGVPSREALEEILGPILSRQRQEPGWPEELSLAAAQAEVLRFYEGLGPLALFAQDADVYEISISGPHQTYLRGAEGWRQVQADFQDAEHFEAFARQLARRAGITATSGFASGTLGDLCLQILRPPLAPTMNLTLRLPPRRRAGLGDLVKEGWLSAPMADFLRLAVAERWNLLITGGAGSGCSTLLAALGAEAPAAERKVVIEERPALQFSGQHALLLRSGPPLRLLTAVRALGPERLLWDDLPEAGLAPFLEHLVRGHRGALAVLPGTGIEAALARSEDALSVSPGRAARRLAGTLHLILDMRRKNNAPMLARVAEVAARGDGTLEARDVFRIKEDAGSGFAFERTGHIPTFLGDLKTGGAAFRLFREVEA